MSFVFYKQIILLLIVVCKLFLCGSKPTHALLVSKRQLIDLKKDALLKCY